MSVLDVILIVLLLGALAFILYQRRALVRGNISAMDVPSVGWSAQPVAAMAGQSGAQQRALAANSRNPRFLAQCLNYGGPEAIRLALINLLATDDTAAHRLGLLFDGMYGTQFGAAGFFMMLTPTMQGVIQTRLEDIPNTEQLRAVLGCNPTLRYDGNGNFTAVTP